MQFVRPDMTNPQTEPTLAIWADPALPADVADLLRRSCADCHSHDTVWPWYARIAPVSWLVAYDVAEAREHMNLSLWNRLDPGERAEMIEEIWEEVEEEEMPLWYYVWLHPRARLSAAERSDLVAGLRATVTAGGPPSAEDDSDSED